MPPQAVPPDLLDFARLLASEASTYPPPCFCADCSTCYYSVEEQLNNPRFAYTRSLTDKAAKAVLAQHMGRISASQEYLLHSIQRFGDHILSRWRKRTKAKRSALLEDEEMVLPAEKGHSVKLNYPKSMWDIQDKTQTRKHYLLPYLDIQTLADNPSTLIGLLHTRAHDSPADWAPFDHEQLRSAWGTGAFDVDFNAGTVVMFGPEYGSLTKWEAEPAHRFDAVGFPRASLILEAQANLMTFLRRVVERLLIGLPETDESGALKWNEVINIRLTKPGEAAAWSTFVHQPFTRPPRFDPDVLLATVKARLEASNDHLWLLQTEPAYLKRYMRNLGQNDLVQSLIDKQTKVALIHVELVQDVRVNQSWHSIYVEFEHMRKIYHTHKDSIRSGATLPKAVDDALGALEVLLVNYALRRSKDLEDSVYKRPGFRHLYTIPQDQSLLRFKPGTPLNIHYKVKKQFTAENESDRTGIALAFRSEKLWWILRQLQGAPDSHTRFGYAMLLDMLDDHLATSSHDERARLDEVLYDKLSDYIAVLELLSAVRLHCPRNTIRTLPDCSRTEQRIGWRLEKTGDQKSYENGNNGGNAIRLLEAFRDTVPPSGQRNRDWLQQYDKLHGAQAKYWQEMSNMFQGYYKAIGLTVDDLRLLQQPLSFRSDADYISRLQRNREQVSAGMQLPNISENEDIFLPLPSAIDGPMRFDVKEERTKVKTRGASAASRASEATEEEQNITSPKPQDDTISLSKRALSTFRSVFPESCEERQKSISWTVFVDSMVDARFAVSNGGGSIVLFEDKSSRKINFHRPHPEPIIDPIMLQSMGRRLNKHFGWTRTTFVLAKK